MISPAPPTALTNRELGSTQGNLQFKHLLAKLVLNLKSTSGSSLKGIKASISGLKVKGTANLSDGKITSSGEATTFSLFINEEGTQAEAILLPQDLSGNLKIKLELNGQSKEIDTQISSSIEQGNKYIYNVNMNIEERWGEGIMKTLSQDLKDAMPMKAFGIKKVIASPGGTNPALVASLQYDGNFEIYSCVDERSAG